MTTDAKALWDDLKAELSNHSGEPHPGFGDRVEKAMAPAYDLIKAFERERDRQPFASQAPCPICGIGTVKYWRNAPLIGGMKCSTSECITLSL
ncbi:hypothetical protein [Methylobacterium sp. CM6247]